MAAWYRSSSRETPWRFASAVRASQPNVSSSTSTLLLRRPRKRGPGTLAPGLDSACLVSPQPPHDHIAHERKPQWWRTRSVPDLVDVHTDVFQLPPVRVEKITLES